MPKMHQWRAFLPGENAKIIDILYGNILPSGESVQLL